MPEPSLRNIWNVIAFLERNGDDVHCGMANEQIANVLRAIHDAYVPNSSPGKKKELNNKRLEATGENTAE